MRPRHRQPPQTARSRSFDVALRAAPVQPHQLTFRFRASEVPHLAHRRTSMATPTGQSRTKRAISGASICCTKESEAHTASG
jgi:hypothetical protein